MDQKPSVSGREEDEAAGWSQTGSNAQPRKGERTFDASLCKSTTPCEQELGYTGLSPRLSIWLSTTPCEQELGYTAIVYRGGIIDLLQDF